MNFYLGLISKYKNELMGFSAIGIILCHAPATLTELPSIVKALMSLGQICVEIFFLLSGIGIFYSLEKNKNILKWYKKRFIRLFVPYLILTIPYYVWFGYINNYSVYTILLNITTLNYWINGSGVWFVAMIIPYYLISPFLYFIYRVSRNKNTMFFIILFFAVYILSFFTGFYKSALYQSSFFLLGMFLAPYIKKNQSINWLNISIIGVLLFIICSKISILQFIPRLFLLLPLAIVIPIIFIDKIYYIKLFSFMGKISLESYLTNVYFPVLLSQYGYLIIPGKYATGNYIQYLLVVILGITVSYLIHKLSNIILNICTKTSLNA